MWVFLVHRSLVLRRHVHDLYAEPSRTTAPLSVLASNTLNLKLGGINTVDPDLSSLTMAMSVWAAQVGKKKHITIFLIVTLILGTVFLGVKAIEYKEKFDHHLVPGHNFNFLRQKRRSLRPVRKRSSHRARRTERAVAVEDKSDPGNGLANLNAHAQLYFSLYFGMTGLHALHMIIGAGLLDLADQGIVQRPLQPRVQYARGSCGFVLALRRYCVDFSVPVALFD